MRLEDFLLGHFSNLSKMYLRDLVKYAQCEVNGRHENRGHRLKPNDFIEIVVDSTRGTAMRPENIQLDIVFEDDDLIVVNKPAGMLVHPSHRENSGTLLNALAFYLNREGEKRGKGKEGQAEDALEISPSPLLPFSSSSIIRPGLPHRLDKQTSGLVVIAKTAHSHRRLSDCFMNKRVEKRYLALVEGIVKDNEGTINAPIGRFADLKLYSVKDDGKPSE